MSIKNREPFEPYYVDDEDADCSTERTREFEEEGYDDDERYDNNKEYEECDEEDFDESSDDYNCKKCNGCNGMCDKDYDKGSDECEGYDESEKESAVSSVYNLDAELKEAVIQLSYRIGAIIAAHSEIQSLQIRRLRWMQDILESRLVNSLILLVFVTVLFHLLMQPLRAIVLQC